jgi:hypothetical protein
MESIHVILTTIINMEQRHHSRGYHIVSLLLKLRLLYISTTLWCLFILRKDTVVLLLLKSYNNEKMKHCFISHSCETQLFSSLIDGTTTIQW